MPKISKSIIHVINFYQRTMSPDHHGIVMPFYVGSCKYYPSCSEYVKTSIMHKGLLWGVIMGCWRILRCNPFSKGGYDPIQ